MSKRTVKLSTSLETASHGKSSGKLPAGVFAVIGSLLIHGLCLSQVWDPPGPYFFVLRWAAVISALGTVSLAVLCTRLDFRGAFRAAWALDWIASLIPMALIFAADLPAERYPRDWFGWLLAAMVLLKAGAAAVALVENLRRGETVSFRLVSLFCFFLYLPLAAWNAVDCPAAGDEPHYLLLAHSLVFDRDFVVGDNYQDRDYRAFEFQSLDEHTVANARGERLLWHDVGTSIFILPGYWAAKRVGAMVMMSLASALLAGAIYVLGVQLGAARTASLVCAFLFAAVAPAIYYASLVYPEVLGATCAAWAAVAFGKYVRSGKTAHLAAAGVLVACLPWISIRFWLLAGPLLGVVLLYLIRHRAPKQTFAAAAGPMLASLVIFAIFDYRHFGSVLPNAGYLAIRESYPQFWLRLHAGLMGLWLDRGYGLLPIAPVFLLVLAGLMRGLPRRWEAAALLAPALAYFGVLAWSQYWDGGWAPPGRYLICTAMLVTPFAARAIESRRARWLTYATAAFALATSLPFAGLPMNRFPSTYDRTDSGITLHLKAKLGLEFSDIFPSLFRDQPRDHLMAAAWLAVFAILLLLSASREVRRTAAAKVAVGVPVAVAVWAMGLWLYGRQPAVMYAQQISSPVRELRMRPNERTKLPVAMQNSGSRKWIHNDPDRPIRLAYQWFAGGAPVPLEAERTPLPRIIEPGERLEAEAEVLAPKQPGDYELRVTMLEEGVAWFSNMSGEYLRIPARVR